MEYLNLNTYKEKLLNESKHVYFPTWFEAIEPEKEAEEGDQVESNGACIPKIVFTEPELTQLRKPWRKSLIIQTVSYTRPIQDIGTRLQKIWKTKKQLEVTEMGQGFYTVKFDNPEESSSLSSEAHGSCSNII